MKGCERVLTMLWLIFIALLLQTPQDPQFPPLGMSDGYGLRGMPDQQIREALEVEEGDALAAKRKETERRLESLPGVGAARIGLVCCDAGKAIIYVGIREKETPSLQFRP